MTRELARRRIAIAGNVAALAGAVAYVMERGFAHAVSTGGPPAIILREARVGYHLALAIAALVALAAALFAADLIVTRARIERAERVLERIALPVLVAAALLLFAWP